MAISQTARMKQGGAFFEVTAPFPVDSAFVDKLKPGYTGKAKIDLGRRPLASVMMRKFLDYWRVEWSPVKYLFLALGLAFAGLHGVAAADAGDKATTSLELKGLIIPFEQANLSSRGTGVIKTLKEEGADFHKGDVIFSLDDDAEKAAVDTQKAVLDKRSWEVESNKKLRGKGGSSEDEERTIIANFKTAEAQVRESEAMVDKKTVRAPFDGVVVRRIRSPGEAVDQYLPVVNVVNLAQVYLETYLPANRLKDVHSGEPVEVRVPDLPGRTYKGRIDFVAPVIDPASGEFRIKILMANEDRSLRSGMSAIGLMQVPSPETPAAR